MTDNVNKALVIDYNNSRLISCGSLFQGICTVRSLGNISLVEVEEVMVEEFIVANTEEASTVAFIAPGPQTDQGLSETQVKVTIPSSSKFPITNFKLKNIFSRCFTLV